MRTRPLQGKKIALFCTLKNKQGLLLGEPGSVLTVGRDVSITIAKQLLAGHSATLVEQRPTLAPPDISQEPSPVQEGLTSSSSSRDPMPWRRVRFTRGSGTRKGIGIAQAQVQIGKRWYEIKIEMDVEGFRALASMPKEARSLLLESLAAMPVRFEALEDHHGGLHDGAARMARYHAQWLGFLCLDFFKKCARLKKLRPYSSEQCVLVAEMVRTGVYGTVREERRDQFSERILSIYEKTLEAMYADGQEHRTPHGMAAYVIERMWCRRFTQWPTRSSPTEDPVRFFKVLKRTNKFKNPIPPKALHDLIDDILADRPVPIVWPHDVYHPLFMTDFRPSRNGTP